MFNFISSLFAQLGINEFNCKRGFTDENGDDVDWIEIYNPTPTIPFYFQIST